MPSHMDGDGYYRCLFPAEQLAKRGWRIIEPPSLTAGIDGTKRSVRMYGDYQVVEEEHLPDGRVRRRFRLAQNAEQWLLDVRFDVLLMQQRDEPFWPGIIGKLRAQGKRVYVDSDDAWWGLPQWNPGSRKPPAEVDAMKALIAAADGMSVATPALADLYRPFQPNIRVIRNRLDWGMWADVVPVYERPTRRLRVGWMGDTEYRQGDLKVLRPFLGAWLKQNPHVEFVAAGDPRTHDLLGIPGGQRVSVADVRFRNLDLADITATFDIGLVPLDLSTPAARRLNECKSHLKGMEYNACGIPFIASPSESYKWYLENGGVGVLATEPREWRRALDTVISVRRRACYGAKMHTIQEHVTEWEAWLADDRCPDPHAAGALLAA